MLDLGPGSFFLSSSDLALSPSSLHGIPFSTQDSLRFYACEIIQEAGILLRMPQAVMATAQVLLHRFFCKRSFRDFDARSIAASCLWLSIKLEECWNRGEKRSPLVDVLNVFERIRARREGEVPLTPECDGFKKRKEELLKLEKRLLVELGFVCHVEHPHKFLLSYLNCLDAPPTLIQEAWNLVNDSLRTTLCVRFPSNVVACGVIYAAARRLGVPLPDRPPWWLLFDVTLEQILEVCRALADLYRKPKAHFIEVRDCALSNPASVVGGREIYLDERMSAEAVDKSTCVQAYQETRESEIAFEAFRVEQKPDKMDETVSNGTPAEPRLDKRRSQDSAQGVKDVSVLSAPSMPKVIDFCVMNAPGAPTSEGALLGGILMVQKNPRKGFQGNRDLVWDGGDERKRDMRHSVFDDFTIVSSNRDYRFLEDFQMERGRKMEHKRRRKEDEISFHRRAKERCSDSLFCRMRDGARPKTTFSVA